MESESPTRKVIYDNLNAIMATLSKDYIKNQLLKTRTYLLFNFTVTKIRVVIHLVEDGTRICGM